MQRRAFGILLKSTIKLAPTEELFIKSTFMGEGEMVVVVVKHIVRFLAGLSISRKVPGILSFNRSLVEVQHS